jgi:hypothetical protein
MKGGFDWNLGTERIRANSMDEALQVLSAVEEEMRIQEQEYLEYLEEKAENERVIYDTTV